MPRNRYSSALLFDHPSKSLRATGTAATIRSDHDDEAAKVRLDMQKDRGQSQSAQIPHANRAIHALQQQQQSQHHTDAVPPPQAQSIRPENRARSEPRGFSDSHLSKGASSTGSLKATARKPVALEVSRAQSNRLPPSMGASRNASVPSDHAPSRFSIATQEAQIYNPVPGLNTRLSTVSRETQIYNPLPSTQSSVQVIDQSSEDVSNNRSLGKKPPPIPPGNAVRRPFLRKRSVADTVSILGTPLPLDASVNLAYHELLKESSGSEIHEIPKTLRNSMVSLHNRNGLVPPPQLEGELQTEKDLPPKPASDHEETSTLRQSFDLQSPPQEEKGPELRTGGLNQSLPKRLPRNREAMRKELNAILDSSQRNAFPIEPTRSVSDSAAGDSLRASTHSSIKSRPMSQQLLSIGPSYSMSSVPRPTSGGVSPLSTPDVSIHRRSRSVSLTSTIHLSPPMHSPPPTSSHSRPCPSALAPALPASPSRDPIRPSSTLSHNRSHSNIGLLPSLLGPPSPSLRPSPTNPHDRKPSNSHQEIRNHRHTISNPTSLLSPSSPPPPSQSQPQVQSPSPSHALSPLPQHQSRPAPSSSQLSKHSISSASSSSLSLLSSSSLTNPDIRRPTLGYARGGIESSPDSPHSLFLPLSTDNDKKKIDAPTTAVAPKDIRTFITDDKTIPTPSAIHPTQHSNDNTTISNASSDSLGRISSSSSDRDENDQPRALPDKTARDLADLLPNSAPATIVLNHLSHANGAAGKQWEDKKKTKDWERQRRKSMRVLGISENESKGVMSLNGGFSGQRGEDRDRADEDDAQPPPIARSRRRDGEKGRGIEELVMAQQQNQGQSKLQSKNGVKGGSKGSSGEGGATKAKVDVRNELRAGNMVSSMGMARRKDALAAVSAEEKEQGRNLNGGARKARRERGSSLSGGGGWFGSLRSKVGFGRDKDGGRR